MYSLKNSELLVSILDPLADVARLGSRYCSGGYIYQITDMELGPLLSGPQYPSPEPDVFDGQGAPDMFFQPLGAEGVAVGGEVGCIGVGRVRRTSPIEPFDVRHNPQVSHYVQWNVHQQSDKITMETEDRFKGWAYRLKREVTLNDRAVLSRTSIVNRGDIPLSLRWFPHPFFPLTADDVLCHISGPVSMPDNPGYYLNEDGFICRKTEHNWGKGWFQPLQHAASSSGITIVQKHPLVGEVTCVTDYAPGFFPIWGNDCTFSFEPYMERTLAPGQEAAWQVVYRF